MPRPEEELHKPAARPVDLRLPTFAWGTDGAAVPPPPNDSDPTLEVWRDRDGRVAAYGHTALGSHWVRLPGVAVFGYDPELDEVMAVVDDGANRSDVAEAYRRVVLPLIQQARRSQVLHASGVRATSGVVAFCGTSGTGKSTLAYGFARRGYPLWGDDAVCFATSVRGVECIPLPFDLLLRGATASFFNTASGSVTSPQAKSDAMEPRRLAAVCVLRAGSGQSSSTGSPEPPVRIAPLASAEAFTATLEHAYSFGLSDKDQRARLVDHYLELVATTPVYYVSFEHGLEQLGVLLDRIEQQLGLAPPPE
jgi:hypothetical protein